MNGSQEERVKKGGMLREKEKTERSRRVWSVGLHRQAEEIFFVSPISNCAIAMETEDLTHAKFSNTEC